MEKSALVIDSFVCLRLFQETIGLELSHADQLLTTELKVDSFIKIATMLSFMFSTVLNGYRYYR